MWSLSNNHEQLEALRLGSEPSTAVDELLRFLSPQVLAGPRFAITNIEIGDRMIAAGRRHCCVWPQPTMTHKDSTAPTNST